MSNKTSKEIINQLLQLYNTGKFIEIINLTKKLIDNNPNEFIFWNFLGASYNKLGNQFEAKNSFAKVIEFNPTFADGYNNLGVIICEEGKLEDAIQIFYKALSLKPDYAEAYNNLGNAFRKKGMLRDAIKKYKKAISIKLNYAEAYNNLGIILQDQQKYDEAIKVLNNAILYKPNFAEAYYNLGNILFQKNKINLAINNFKKAVSLNSKYFEAYMNLGVAFKSQGKLKEAIKLFEKTLLIEPKYVKAYYNMALSFNQLGNQSEAILNYKKAIKINTKYTESYYNLGILLFNEGRLAEALKLFDKILEYDPKYERAIAQKIFQNLNICKWDKFDHFKKIVSKLGTQNDYIPPFSLLSIEDSAKNQKKRSINYSKNKFVKRPFEKLKNSTKKKRIHIGYFSSDFYNHATMYLLKGIFKNHNKNEFNIYIYDYSINNNYDYIKNDLFKSNVIFRNVVDKSNEDIALLARKDEIDIAVDLKGHTQNSRSGIFAYRAAPIQINFLGYPGTMGCDFMDYIIADKIVIPNNKKSFYSEKVVYLPHSYQPNDNQRIISENIDTKKEMKLPNNSFIFCCFNNNYKITPIEFDIWMRILNKVEDSVIWLMESNHLAKHNLINEAKKRGVSNQRLIFAKKLPQAQHLARHQYADLFLDTFNVNAHTTASDALWSGLPVVTKLGNSFPSRVAGSLLKAVGLEKLITENVTAYENLILEIAREPKKLLEIKKKLADRRLSYPLFNTALYTKNLEKSYKNIYRNFINKKKSI